jgi:hypothetical protein
VVRDDTPPAPAPTPLPEQHGDKWQNADDEPDGGGFKSFKEVWVYQDGKPLGVLREVELPPIPEVWVDEVEYLDFKAGDPGPHERIFQVRRWRIADYLEAVGVSKKKIKAVVLHSGKGVVLIEGDLFRKHADKIQFSLTGQKESKLKIYYPAEVDKAVNNSYDRYAAISVIVDKDVPALDDSDDLVIDGTKVEGIPFYGQPLRGGIRVYLDGRLAMIIKRNSLGEEGRLAPDKDEWNLGALLRARAIELGALGAIDVVDPVQISERLTLTDPNAITFSTDSQAQGAVKLSTGDDAQAIMLWSDGKVPPVRQTTPASRDKK